MKVFQEHPLKVSEIFFHIFQSPKFFLNYRQIRYLYIENYIENFLENLYLYYFRNFSKISSKFLTFFKLFKNFSKINSCLKLLKNFSGFKTFQCIIKKNSKFSKIIYFKVSLQFFQSSS